MRTRLLTGFDDPSFHRDQWNALLAAGGSNVAFLTWEYQKAWWESFERSGLMLILLERDGRPLALAPFFAEEGMVYFVGSGGSDYLDFIGDVREPGVLNLLLEAARGPDFTGFLLYHIPESSPTPGLLERAAEPAGLTCVDEGVMPAPMIDCLAFPEAMRGAPGKESLVRKEKRLRREGVLEIEHLTTGDEILPHLSVFMDLHIKRWAETPTPSAFLKPTERRFIEAMTRLAGESGWLRFTRAVWNGLPLACHFGFCHHGSWLIYRPTYDVSFAAYSPGQVLLRHMLLRAQEEHVSVFDFGLGDEEYKRRFATSVRMVKNIGLYPS